MFHVYTQYVHPRVGEKSTCRCSPVLNSNHRVLLLVEVVLASISYVAILLRPHENLAVGPYSLRQDLDAFEVTVGSQTGCRC